MSDNIKYHWFLFSFIGERSCGGVHYSNINIGQESKNVTSKDVKNATKYAKSLNDYTDSLVITSISYLGEMTKEEFNGGSEDDTDP